MAVVSAPLSHVGGMVVAPPTIAEPAYRGLVELVHDGRPQAHRHPVRRFGRHLLRHRRPRSPGHPAAALDARQHAGHRADVQRAVHHARHDDDLPGDHADGRRLLQFHPAAANRGSRRRLPAPERLQLLGVHPRRDHAQHQFSVGWRARRGLVRLRQPHHPPVLAWSGHRLLDAGPADARRGLHRGGAELLRHHPQHARARA